MIKNKTNYEVAINYDGKTRRIGPGQTISVAEAFGLTPGDGKAQEHRFVQKQGGKLVFCEEGVEKSAETQPKPAAAVKPSDPVPAPEEENAEEKKEVPPPTNAESLEKYSKKELLEMAVNLGLVLSAKLNKEQIIIELDQKMKEHEAGG